MARPRPLTHRVVIPVHELHDGNRNWNGVHVTLPGLSADELVEVFDPCTKQVTYFPTGWLQPMSQPQPRPRRATR